MNDTLTEIERQALDHLCASRAMGAHLQHAAFLAHVVGPVTGRTVARYLARELRDDPAVGTDVKVALAGAGPAAQRLALAWLAKHPAWDCDRPDPGPDVRWHEWNPF